MRTMLPNSHLFLRVRFNKFKYKYKKIRISDLKKYVNLREEEDVKKVLRLKLLLVSVRSLNV